MKTNTRRAAVAAAAIASLPVAYAITPEFVVFQRCDDRLTLADALNRLMLAAPRRSAVIPDPSGVR